jgi:hypothetical protein
MDFTFDSAGTGRQIQWVKDAIASCSFDHTLLPIPVRVVWEETLPESSDIGHLHSYMVTEGDGGTGFIVHIAKWADDPTNPNNQGLPDPQSDIYDFYKQSFVHELGHIVQFSDVITDLQRSEVAALFWTADASGGSGRRYGTLADWTANTWAQNMQEAVAETFKVVYYTGRLIYRNRTIWRIDAGAWNSLWTLLMPPIAGLYRGKGGGSGGNFNISVPTQFGLHYLDLVRLIAVIGPGIQIPTPTPPNPGGTFAGNISLLGDDGAGHTSVLVDVSLSIVAQNQFGSHPGEIDGSLSCDIGPVNFLANVPFDNGQNFISIEADSIQGSPGQFQVTVTSPAGVAQGVTTLTNPTDRVTAISSGLFGGVLNYPVAFTWGVRSSALPPPFPGGADTGSIGVGLGLRGAVLIGG